MIDHTTERLALTNQLINLQVWEQNDDTKKAIEIVLERLRVLDELEKRSD